MLAPNFKAEGIFFCPSCQCSSPHWLLQKLFLPNVSFPKASTLPANSQFKRLCTAYSYPTLTRAKGKGLSYHPFWLPLIAQVSPSWRGLASSNSLSSDLFWDQNSVSSEWVTRSHHNWPRTIPSRLSKSLISARESKITHKSSLQAGCNQRESGGSDPPFADSQEPCDLGWPLSWSPYKFFGTRPKRLLTFLLIPTTIAPLTTIGLDIDTQWTHPDPRKD